MPTLGNYSKVSLEDVSPPVCAPAETACGWLVVFVVLFLIFYFLTLVDVWLYLRRREHRRQYEAIHARRNGRPLEYGSFGQEFTSRLASSKTGYNHATYTPPPTYSSTPECEKYTQDNPIAADIFPDAWLAVRPPQQLFNPVKLSLASLCNFTRAAQPVPEWRLLDTVMSSDVSTVDLILMVLLLCYTILMVSLLVCFWAIFRRLQPFLMADPMALNAEIQILTTDLEKCIKESEFACGNYTPSKVFPVLLQVFYLIEQDLVGPANDMPASNNEAST
ncbi:hypothetical protein FISHEDRAFT_55929 [Fistulina hepatica ATCC 64428]|uniref:Uncharacterized protein n=1 Tax=Fistulina hepatica ATCC 64428 TaxID=1128425 RepID=A0A0D7ANQ8_9AGAR|nr:hypothetical protein FISHEDRAFT_55929 [Fistulina hepatica ATCC 64428]